MSSSHQPSTLQKARFDIAYGRDESAPTGDLVADQGIHRQKNKEACGS